MNAVLVCHKELLIFIIFIFVLYQCWRARKCDVMGEGIHKIEICLHSDSRHSGTVAASQPLLQEKAGHVSPV